MLLALLTACSEYALDKRETEPSVPEPDIVVEPSHLEWENLGLNCMAEQLVTVTNVGTGPLTLPENPTLTSISGCTRSRGNASARHKTVQASVTPTNPPIPPHHPAARWIQAKSL